MNSDSERPAIPASASALPPGATPDDLAVQVRRVLEQRYTEPMGCSTSNLASEFGVTASHLCHAYKDAWDTTIGSDLRRLRIALAKRLLLHAELPIKQVAAYVGYRDATYRAFFNAFRDETGMPPSRYRRLALRHARELEPSGSGESARRMLRTA